MCPTLINSFIKQNCNLGGPLRFFDRLYLTPLGHLLMQIYAYETLKTAYKFITQEKSDDLWNLTRKEQFVEFHYACIQLEPEITDNPETTQFDRSQLIIFKNKFPDYQINTEDLVYNPNFKLYSDVYEYIYHRYGLDTHKIQEEYEELTRILTVLKK